MLGSNPVSGLSCIVTPRVNLEVSSSLWVTSGINEVPALSWQLDSDLIKFPGRTPDTQLGNAWIPDP